MTLQVPDFSGVTVLTVGDLMLDQYWFGSTSRISPEAPVPVVNVNEAQSRAGGAANVAVNLASLGVNTVLVGVTGVDSNGEKLRQLLVDQGIQLEVAEVESRPTITKLRVLSRNQQLIRLDTEDTFDVKDVKPLGQIVENQIAAANVCILSDYAKGTLARAPEIISICRAQKVTVLADPKGTDFTRYRGASVLTPTRVEF